MHMLKDFQYKDALMVAGPIVFGRKFAKRYINFLKIFNWNQFTIFLFSKLVRIFFALRPQNSPIMDMKDKDQTYLVQSILEDDLYFNEIINHKCTILLNSKDELVNNESISRIKKIFLNADIKYLHTKSHWLPVDDEEIKFTGEFFSTLK